MTLRLSSFGEKYCGHTGIAELMDDLGHALAEAKSMRVLGGGTPALIPEMEAIWRGQMESLLRQGDALDRVLGCYDSPRGNPAFIKAVCTGLNEAFGWSIGPSNVAITTGGQSAFYYLFNMLAGRCADGAYRHILFPLSPEYIGYADQPLESAMFRSTPALVEEHGRHGFKYKVDFANLKITPETAALCVSRPTNPTGNVLTDDEIAHLTKLADANNIPLIIDNAYGAPFPNVIFTESRPAWSKNIIFVCSLSKLGLPGTRTGIVIARPEVTQAIARMTAILGLSNNNVGQALARGLLERHELIPMCRRIIMPFYRDRSQKVQAWVAEYFDDSLPYRVHVSEGAFFLWLWFPGLPITTYELYERLKKRGVLVVPGKCFFYGSDKPSPQRDECIRVSFTQAEEDVREGIAAIADEVGKAYSQRIAY